MKKIVAFAGSNSINSINKKLVAYSLRQLKNVNPILLDLNDFELPIYSIDYEKEYGIPENAKKFYEILASADGIIISLAEHNGAYSAAFKNIYDWMSRINSKLLGNIPMLLMATSPGGRGGAGVLGIAKGGFPHMGGNIIADFSLPSFNKNFSEEGIQDELLNKEYQNALEEFEIAI
jgi:chromate reductase